jgi:signal transduction histidine kinase
VRQGSRYTGDMRFGLRAHFRLHCLPGIAALFAMFAPEAWAQARGLTPLFRTLDRDFRILDDRRAALEGELQALPATPVNQQSERLGYQFWRSVWDPEPEGVWVELDLGKDQPLDAIVLVPVDAPYREFPGPGYGFPPRFRVETRGGTDKTAQVIADHTAEDFANPGGLPIWLPVRGKTVRHIRVTMSTPWRQRDGLDVFALGEIMALRGQANVTAALPAGAGTTSISFESRHVWSRANLSDGQSVLGAPSLAEASRTLGFHSAMADRSGVTKWVQVDLGESVALDEVRLVPARVPQFPGRSGFGFPLRFKVELSDDAHFHSAMILADETGADFVNPATNPVTVSCTGRRGRFVRVTASKLWQRAENFAFCLAELQAYADGVNVALGRPVTASDVYPGKSGAWMLENLTDGYSSEWKLTEWPAWLQGLSRRREALGEKALVEVQLADAHRQLQLLFERGVVGLTLLAATGIGYALLKSRQLRRRELELLRQRIAGDLHDDIGSNLGNIALLSEIAAEHGTEATREDLQEIHRIAQETAESMRDIVSLLQRPSETTEDLAQRLRQIAGRMLAGIVWTFTSEGLRDLPPLEMQRHVVLSFKEMLHNIRKHAAAKEVQIQIACHGRELTLEVCDEGLGFDPTLAPDGHGLVSLRQRALKLGGELRITTAPGKGTRIVLTARL